MQDAKKEGAELRGIVGREEGEQINKCKLSSPKECLVVFHFFVLFEYLSKYRSKISWQDDRDIIFMMEKNGSQVILV